MKVFVIGIGLIGGSMALDIKLRFPKATIYGIDLNETHLQQALELKIIDRTATLEDIPEADIIILSVPVDATKKLLPVILDRVADQTLVFDVGSTKQNICQAVEMHRNRGNFLATHPIAGTEFSGPGAALRGLFAGKTQIICEPEKVKKTLFERALHLFEAIGMRIIYMDPTAHDKHIAYCSHLSHVCSFMLGKTVIEKEKDEEGILNLAGSGFASTVRLAKSSPAMWTPIFIDNKENILKSLDEFINNLSGFRKALSSEDGATLFNEMKNTNRIKEILKEIG